MRNPVLYYAAIVVGVIGIAVGIYFLTTNHPARAEASIAVGVVLLIAGIVGIFFVRSRTVRP